jgi:hypothetical protein
VCVYPQIVDLPERNQQTNIIIASFVQSSMTKKKCFIIMTIGLSSLWSSPPQTTGSGTNVIEHFTAVISVICGHRKKH